MIKHIWIQFRKYGVLSPYWAVAAELYMPTGTLSGSLALHSPPRASHDALPVMSSRIVAWRLLDNLWQPTPATEQPHVQTRPASRTRPLGTSGNERAHHRERVKACTRSPATVRARGASLDRAATKTGRLVAEPLPLGSAASQPSVVDDALAVRRRRPHR
jgi:hypothetical protein